MVPDSQVGIFTSDNPVGIGDNFAFSCLAENLFQFYCRDTAGINQIPQNISCSDAGQLVGVADQNQLAAHPASPQQRFKQSSIYHRHLVDDNCVSLKRVAFIVDEIQFFPGAEIHFQQPVDGFGFPSGHFTDSFGCPSGRCCDGDGQALLLQQVDDRIEGGGLAGAGTASQDQHTFLQCRPDGVSLQRFIMDIFELFDVVDHPVDVPADKKAVLQHHRKPQGNILFRIVHGWQKQKFPVALNRKKFLFFNPLVDVRLNRFDRRVGQTLNQLDNGLPCKTGVPVSEVVAQDMAGGTKQPFAGVFRDAERQCNLISLLKSAPMSSRHSR